MMTGLAAAPCFVEPMSSLPCARELETLGGWELEDMLGGKAGLPGGDVR